MNDENPWLLAINGEGLDSAGLWLEYDREKSTLDSIKIMRCEKIDPSEGSIVYKLKGRAWRKLDQYHILPFSVANPIVSNELKLAIEQIVPASDVYFFPITTHHKSGAVFHHWALMPLTEVPCLDLEKSDITSWIIPDEVVLFYEKLKFIPVCLGEKDIVRNQNLTSQILLSGKLKEVIEKYSRENICFLRDFEIERRP